MCAQERDEADSLDELRRSEARIKQLEQDCQESEAKYQRLVEQIPAITYTAAIDEASIVFYISPQVVTVLGYTPEECRLNRDIWRERLHPDDRERVLTEIARCRASGEPLACEYRMIARDGRVVWFRDEGTFLRDEATGRINCLQGILVDITDRKQEERQNEVMRLLAIRLAACANVEGMIDAVQEATSDLFAWDAHYFAAKSEDEFNFRVLYYVDTIGGKKTIFLPENRLAPNLSEPLRPLLSGEPVLINRVPGEPGPSFHRFGDNSRPSASLMYVPVRNGKTVIGVLSAQSYTYYRYNEADLYLFQRVANLVAPALERGCAEEVLRSTRDELEVRVHERTTDLAKANESLMREAAERKQAEISLRSSEERYRTLAESAEDYIYIIGCDERYRYINQYAAAHMGGRPEDFIGKTLQDIFPPDVAEQMNQNVRKVLESGAVLSMERLLPFADRPVWLHTRLVPLRQENGEIYAVFGLSRDITSSKRIEAEREQLGAQLRQAQKLEAVGLLAGGISHEFNNLLTVILGNIDLAFQAGFQNKADEVIADVLKEVRQAAERAAVLTRQLLAFSRRSIPNPRPFDPSQVIMGMENMLRRLIGESIQVSIVTAPDKSFILADTGQIEQAILNLAINARDAMPQGGQLTIQVATVVLDDQHVSNHLDAKTGPHVMITVSDSGTGMDENVRSHLFEPFFTTKPVGKGTGLGLAMVYGIVRQADGHVIVESSPGAGSTFRLYFPAVRGAAPVEDRPAPNYAGGTETILLCEDDQLLRRLARRTLEDQGYHVIEAENGMEGIKAAAGHPGAIDLVVTDLIMPQMDGRELADAMKKAYPAVRVLFISGYASDMLDSTVFSQGESAYLQKPFNPEQLLQYVRQVLDTRRKPVQS